MFNPFRKQDKPAPFKGVYIDGNLYSRYGSGVCMTSRDSSEATMVEAGHAAPNGVSVAQIAYAIAIVEGFIGISIAGSVENPYNQPGYEIGLN